MAQLKIKDFIIKDKEWFEVKKITNVSCCDCGLSHRIRIKNIDDKFFISFERDEKLTIRNKRINPVFITQK